MALTIEELRLEVDRDLDKFSRVAYISTSTRIQTKTVETFTVLMSRLGKAKLYFIRLRANKEANTVLAYEALTDALRSEIKCMVALKSDKPDLAWEHLIHAQEAALVCSRIGLTTAGVVEQHVKRLELLEKLLFPEQQFVSSGLIIGASSCSICSNNFSDCDHLKGFPYMGEICRERIEDIVQVQEISLVDLPADKRCRLLHVGQGIERTNWMSTELEPENNYE